MLDSGANINALDEHGQTALMNAVHRGNLEIVKILVERDAELNNTAKLCLTALYLAAIGNRQEMVRLLIDAGADREIKGSSEQFYCSPLEYAQHYGMSEIISIFREYS